MDEKESGYHKMVEDKRRHLLGPMTETQETYAAPCCPEKALPPGSKVLVCSIPYCSTVLGLFQPAEIHAPVMAGMFTSLCEHHALDPPFRHVPGRDAGSPWDQLRCRVCDTQVFVDRLTLKHVTKLMTPHGELTIGDADVPHVETQEERNHVMTEGVIGMWGNGERKVEDLDDDEPQRVVIDRYEGELVGNRKSHLVTAEVAPPEVPPIHARDRVAKMIKMRESGMNNRAIGKEFGISPGRVSQIINKETRENDQNKAQ